MKQSQKIQQVKQQAARMSARMNKMGFALTPRQALELVAAERGFATWHAFEADLRKPEPKMPRWKRAQGPMSQEQYLAKREHEIVCPVCGSDEVAGDFTEIDGNQALQQCTCNECESVWEDHYVAKSYTLTHNGLGTDSDARPTMKAYQIAVYGAQGFIAKGLAFGDDETAARQAFARERISVDNTSVEYSTELVAEVRVSVKALLTWWKANDAAEDALDELVYEVVQERGLPALNEEPDDEAQDARLGDHEAQASRINNEGIEAQLRYLLSVCPAAELLTRMVNDIDIGLEGTPPAA